MECKQCPLQEDYKFKDVCRINTCKNYSLSTKSRCLGIDIRFASDGKTITDGELLHYKFNDREVSIRDVALIRKKALDNVKSAITLYRLVHHIHDNENPYDSSHYEYGTSATIDKVLKRKPLCIKKIGFKPWMLKFLIDENYVSQIVGPKFKVRNALGLKTKEYSHFVSAVKIASKGDATLFGRIV